MADNRPSADEEATRRKSCRNFRNSLLGLPGILALAVLALDQLTKWLVVLAWPVPYEDVFVVIPGVLRLVHWRNTGAAWGIFASHTWLLTLISAVACLALALGFDSFTDRKPMRALPAGVLLGGIAGNLIDRAFYPQGVIDFISLPHYPAFNVADSAITCSIIFIIACEFLRGRKATKDDSLSTSTRS